MTDQAALRKRLETLVKTGDNRFCADCGKRGAAKYIVLHVVAIIQRGIPNDLVLASSLSLVLCLVTTRDSIIQSRCYCVTML